MARTTQQKEILTLEVEIRGNEPITDQEIDAYIARTKKHYPNIGVSKIILEAEGEYVTINYEIDHADFQRIRRITGYLVGDTSRWNSSKMAELNDRLANTTS